MLAVHNTPLTITQDLVKIVLYILLPPRNSKIHFIIEVALMQPPSTCLSARKVVRHSRPVYSRTRAPTKLVSMIMDFRAFVAKAPHLTILCQRILAYGGKLFSKNAANVQGHISKTTRWIRVRSCWVFIANSFFSSHQQSVVQRKNKVLLQN